MKKAYIVHIYIYIHMHTYIYIYIYIQGMLYYMNSRVSIQMLEPKDIDNMTEAKT